MLTLPAIRIRQKDVTLYLTALTLEQLRARADVDYWRPNNPEGYQRPLSDRRLGEIARYILDEEGVLPTSILACAREETKATLAFRQQGGATDGPEFGEISLPDGLKLWVVDGQNRLFGTAKAYDKEGGGELGRYPFPVTIMTGVDRFTEMVHFSIINTRGKKMPTDIVDRHLVQRRETEGHEMILRGRRGEKEYARAKVTKVIDRLDEMPGPWEGKIAVPGVEGRDRGLVRQHAMVASLEAAMKDPWLAMLNEEEIATVLNRYWLALQEYWPTAFATPEDHRIQATVGIYALHLVLPSVIQLCVPQKDFSVKAMAQIWKNSGLAEDFWHKTEGDPMTLGTGMQSIRLLADRLRDSIAKNQKIDI